MFSFFSLFLLLILFFVSLSWDGKRYVQSTCSTATFSAADLYLFSAAVANDVHEDCRCDCWHQLPINSQWLGLRELYGQSSTASIVNVLPWRGVRIYICWKKGLQSRRNLRFAIHIIPTCSSTHWSALLLGVKDRNKAVPFVTRSIWVASSSRIDTSPAMSVWLNT